MTDTGPMLDKRYVRVRNKRDGFVEFDFSIGDPALHVELILNEAAFAEFCRDNAVEQLDDEAVREIDAYKDAWVNPDRNKE